MADKKTTNSNLHDGAPVYMKEAEKAQVNSNIRITCFYLGEDIIKADVLNYEFKIVSGCICCCNFYIKTVNFSVITDILKRLEGTVSYNYEV